MAASGWIARAAVGLAAALLAGCVPSPDPTSLDWDPFEEQNREAHALTRQVDRALYRPVSRAYGETVPQVARTGVKNVVNQLNMPRVTLQYVLQGNVERAAEATLRFAVNTVFGLGGLLDPATEFGLPYRESNFDETFYTWGIPEGGYWELPLIGPGTQRDWTGYALDQVADPVFYLTGGSVALANTALVLRGLDIVNDRYELDPVIEALYYESTDSYVAQRISYLQNMRTRLMGGTDLSQLEDVYGDY